MPGYKHPCPFCATFIDSGVAACPFCGVTDPFTHGRCPDCRTPLQPGWVACPNCGRSLTVAETAAPGPGAPAATPTVMPATPVSSGAAGRCTGCGAALPAGARFCVECGTLVS